MGLWLGGLVGSAVVGLSVGLLDGDDVGAKVSITVFEGIV